MEELFGQNFEWWPEWKPESSEVTWNSPNVKDKYKPWNQIADAWKSGDRVYAEWLLKDTKEMDINIQKGMLEPLILDLINVQNAKWPDQVFKISNWNGFSITQPAWKTLTVDFKPIKDRWFAPEVTIKFPWTSDVVFQLATWIGSFNLLSFIKIDLFENDNNYWILRAIKKNATADQLTILSDICLKLMDEYPEKTEKLQFLRDKFIASCDKTVNE